jgi:nickel-dependent lactate racemase
VPEKIKLELPYLDKTFPLEFPAEELLAIVEPNEAPAASLDQHTLLREALRRPWPAGSFTVNGRSPAFSEAAAGDGGFDDFIRGGRSFLVIVNDATRPTPTAAMLETLLPVLEKAGVGDKKLTLIVATGAHRAPTAEDYRQILGPLHDRLKPRCVFHDARKEERLVYLGKTRGGTPILLNKILFEADRIIVTGSVEPHYHAGYTGGRKAFLPGIAGFATIQANHARALSPKARALALEGNPVHEDMMDALAFVKAPVFSFMSVLDKQQKVAAAACGDIMASFYAAVENAGKIFCVPIPAKADIVVSLARRPMDIDLYQSQKAIDNGALALKDGGTLILVSPCREGIGDEAYAKLLEETASPCEALQRIRDGYRLGYQKAAKMAEVSARAALKAVTLIPARRLAKMFIQSAETPQKALDEAREALRGQGISRPRILILPDGCVTIPQLPDADQELIRE